jgi:hypothetical protein
MLIHSQRPPINHFASLFSCAIECAQRRTSPLVLYGYGFEWAEVVIEIGLILCQVALALFLLITSCTQPDAASSFSLSLARHMTRLYSNCSLFSKKTGLTSHLVIGTEGYFSLAYLLKFHGLFYFK